MCCFKQPFIGFYYLRRRHVLFLDFCFRGGAGGGGGGGPISFDLLNGQSNKSNPIAYEFADGTQRTFRPNIYDNPYWAINKNTFNSNVNRSFGYAQLSYKITDWLTAALKSGLDYYTDNRHLMYGINSNASFGNAGRIVEDVFTYRHHDNYLNLSGEKQISNDFRINYLVGGNYYYEATSELRTQGDNLFVPDFNNIQNAANISTSLHKEKIVRNAVYGSFDAAWREMLFLTLTGRNDWSSTRSADLDFIQICL